MSGIEVVASGIEAELQRRLPRQRKTQRGKLALLVATMLSERSANLMDLAAALPRPAERVDMRYQWISRLLGNGLVDVDTVMAPHAREVLARLAADGRTIVLLIDQTQVSARHQVIMVAARVGGRALPPPGAMPLEGVGRWRGGSSRPKAPSAFLSSARPWTRWPACCLRMSGRC